MIRRFLGHVMPGIIRPLRVLWNEIIGFFFLVLALLPVPWAIRNLRQVEGDSGNFFRVVLSLGWFGVMAYFGITSFLRARRISRS